MTLAPSDRYVRYDPTSPQVEFDVDFPLFDNEDISVYVDGVEITDYSVAGTFSDGAYEDAVVTLVNAVSEVSVEIYGSRTPEFESSYKPNGPSMASAFSLDMQKIVAVQQEQARDARRYLASVPNAVSEAGNFAKSAEQNRELAQEAAEEAIVFASMAKSAASGVGSKFWLGVDQKYGFATAAFDLDRQGPGSGNVVQGAVHDPFTRELITLHVTGGDEVAVLNSFDALGGKSQTSFRYSHVGSNIPGHQQLAIEYLNNGSRRFWTAANDSVADYGYKATSFSMSNLGVDDLQVGNEEVFQLFETSLNALTNNVTVSIDKTGRYLVAELQTANDVVLLRVFDLQQIRSHGIGDVSHLFIAELEVTGFADSAAGYPLQALLMDFPHVMLVAGDADINTVPRMAIYDVITGDQVIYDGDFNIGINEALNDGSGLAHEVEGMFWFWLGPRQVVPAIVVASGDSGNRKSRIWLLGVDIINQDIGVQGRPARLLKGSLAVPDGQGFDLVAFDGLRQVATKFLSFDSNGVASLGDRNSGTFTISVADAPTGGNVSPTTGVGRWSRNGDVMTLVGAISNIDTTGLAAGNNLYLRGEALNPAASDCNFTMTPVISTPGDAVLDDFNLASGSIGYRLSLLDSGVIAFLNIFDGANHTIANVSSFTSGQADIEFSIQFMVA